MYRFNVSLFVWACCLAWGLPAASAQEAPTLPIEQRAETLRHQDSGSAIEEQRVGGQTRDIRVQTPSAWPAYHVHPQNSTDGPGAGKSHWRLIAF